ncbi:hypothetical protein BC828DRAFT_389764 [Blastocladiella britannica]|nr:hypothetical protein BC828DRAFT_389764 [Blastocladiella britannica]
MSQSNVLSSSPVGWMRIHTVVALVLLLAVISCQAAPAQPLRERGTLKLPVPVPQKVVPSQVLSAGASLAPHWCCREQGKCQATQCATTVKYGVTWYGGTFRTNDSCMQSKCASVCIRTTRDCATFFF